MGNGINEIPSALQTVQFLKDKQLVDVERPEPKLEPETYNMPTDSSLNTDMLWGQGADNSTQQANATPMQNPAPQPNNYTAANANITNNLTASATNIANALKSKASSAFSAVKGWMNGKRTPIEKTAAYFGDNTSDIPINFPELGADEQQKPGRRQIPKVPSYLDDQEVNLPRDPQQPKLEPETQNNPTNSPFNMDELHWQGAGNSTQSANATQTQMPAVAPNSSKNTATDVVKGINAGVNALGAAAAVVYAVNNGVYYSDDIVTYNRITKTLTIKSDFYTDDDLDVINLQYKNIGIGEAETIVIDDGVKKGKLYGVDFPHVKKIIVSKTVSFLDFNKAAFDSLEEIEVSFGSPYYWSGNGVLFDRTKKFLVILKKFPAGKTDKEYAVPTFVGDIAREAFDSCSNLEKITMENDLVLESNSFSNCENLKEVCFNSQENTAKKSKDAFSQCGNAKVYMPNMNQDQLPQTFGGLPVIKGAPPQQQP